MPLEEYIVVFLAQYFFIFCDYSQHGVTLLRHYQNKTLLTILYHTSHCVKTH